jgi:hypothetical protein
LAFATSTQHSSPGVVQSLERTHACAPVPDPVPLADPDPLLVPVPVPDPVADPDPEDEPEPPVASGEPPSGDTEKVAVPQWTSAAPATKAPAKELRRRPRRRAERVIVLP